MSGGLPDAVPVLPVSDLARALAFYERLGFEVRVAYAQYAILGYARTELHLTEVPEVAGHDTWSGAYLRVTDVDAVHAHWTAMGAPSLRPPTDEPYGVREFATEDVDGNLWRVGTPLTAPDDAVGDGGIAEPSGSDPGDDARVPDDLVRLGAPPEPAPTDGEASGTIDEPAPTDGSIGTGAEAWYELVADGRRCAGCGLLSGELHERAIGAEIRDLVHAFGELLVAADDDHVRTRPTPTSWSALEYGVHIRDLLTVYAERIVRTLAEHDPVLIGWDHEAAIEDGMANESDVQAVADDMGRNAGKLSEALRLVTEDDWGRPASRGTERFTIELLARFALHEVVHHRVDAERALATASR